MIWQDKAPGKLIWIQGFVCFLKEFVPDDLLSELFYEFAVLGSFRKLLYASVDQHSSRICWNSCMTTTSILVSFHFSSQLPLYSYLLFLKSYKLFSFLLFCICRSSSWSPGFVPKAYRKYGNIKKIQLKKIKKDDDWISYSGLRTT